MDEIVTKRINGLGNRGYIYGIDMISFIKSLKKAGIENSVTAELAKAVGSFNDVLLDLEDSEDIDSCIAGLKKTGTFTDQILGLFRKTTCSKELLQEKSDLVVETYELIKEIDELKFLLTKAKK